MHWLKAGMREQKNVNVRETAGQRQSKVTSSVGEEVKPHVVRQVVVVSGEKGG